MDEIAEHCLKDHIKFLQAHDEDYSDRYVYNIFQTLNTFLQSNGILIARPLLAKLGPGAITCGPFPAPLRALSYPPPIRSCDVLGVSAEIFRHSAARLRASRSAFS